MHDFKAVAEHITFEETGSFSALVKAYLQGNETLRPFYSYHPDLNGIEEAIIARKNFRDNRKILTNYLKNQYNGLSVSKAVVDNLSRLQNSNCYTVCTAHQPNIFTGPLYFIYKIFHAIVLAQELNGQFKQYQFVPIYYMGSEDADLDELGEVNVQGTQYRWTTEQSGAVGRMEVDDGLLLILEKIKNQISVLPYGNELISKFEESYKKGRRIDRATLELVNELFGEYGLVVFVPDDDEIKQPFLPIIKKELSEQFSSKAVAETIEAFPEDLKIQTAGREINLFYLTDDARQRIEKTEDGYTVGDRNFTEKELLSAIENDASIISPNVVLRPVFQEYILPNVVFIGGGGELAYWLELKKVFQDSEVPYPVLMLRNSFVFLNRKSAEIISNLQFSNTDLFKPLLQLSNEFVTGKNGERILLNEEMKKLHELYAEIENKANSIDITLATHTKALAKIAGNKLEMLQKKMLRAGRRKESEAINKINRLKEFTHPNNNLQERVFNFSAFYAAYGKDWMQSVHDNSPAIDPKFIILKEEKAG